jgi:hypothetical protein
MGRTDIGLRGFGSTVVACGLLAAGCGSSSSSKSSTAATAAGSTPATTAAPVTAAQYDAKLKELLSSSGGPPSVPGAPPPTTTPSLPISSVTCPASLKPASGSFKCTVTGAAGLNGSVTVTPTDATGHKFKFKAHLAGNGVVQDSSGNSSI